MHAQGLVAGWPRGSSLLLLYSGNVRVICGEYLPNPPSHSRSKSAAKECTTASMESAAMCSCKNRADIGGCLEPGEPIFVHAPFFNVCPPVRLGLLANFSKLVLKALANNAAGSTFEVNVVHIKVCLDVKSVRVHRYIK